MYLCISVTPISIVLSIQSENSTPLYTLLRQLYDEVLPEAIGTSIAPFLTQCWLLCPLFSRIILSPADMDSSQQVSDHGWQFGERHNRTTNNEYT